MLLHAYLIAISSTQRLEGVGATHEEFRGRDLHSDVDVVLTLFLAKIEKYCFTLITKVVQFNRILHAKG